MANIIQQLKDAQGNNIYPIAYVNGGVKIDLLWTNPSPTQNFNAQTLSLDSTGYDMLMITAKNVPGGGVYYNNLIYKGMTEQQFIASFSSDGVDRRGITSVTDSSIVFNTGYVNATSGAGYAIPYKIYGIKLSYVVPTVVQGLQYIEV